MPDHKCPACQHPLRAVSEDGTVMVWCGFGKCPSASSNDGIKGVNGETAEQLADALIAKLEDILDWSEQ